MTDIANRCIKHYRGVNCFVRCDKSHDHYSILCISLDCSGIGLKLNYPIYFKRRPLALTNCFKSLVTVIWQVKMMIYIRVFLLVLGFYSQRLENIIASFNIVRTVQSTQYLSKARVVTNRTEI